MPTVKAKVRAAQSTKSVSAIRGNITMPVIALTPNTRAHFDFNRLDVPQLRQLSRFGTCVMAFCAS